MKDNNVENLINELLEEVRVLLYDNDNYYSDIKELEREIEKNKIRIAYKKKLITALEKLK